MLERRAGRFGIGIAFVVTLCTSNPLLPSCESLVLLDRTPIMSSDRGSSSAASDGGRRGRSAARGVVDSQARPTPPGQPPATAIEPHYTLASSLGIYHTAHQQGHLPAYSRPMSSHESMSPSMLSSFQSQQQQQSPPPVRYSVRDVYGQLLYHVPLAHGGSVKQVSVDVVIAAAWLK